MINFDPIATMVRVFTFDRASALGCAVWYSGKMSQPPAIGTPAEAALRVCGADAPILSKLKLTDPKLDASALLDRLQPDGDLHNIFFHDNARANVAKCLSLVAERRGFSTRLPKEGLDAVVPRVCALPAALWLALELSLGGESGAEMAAHALLAWFVPDGSPRAALAAGATGKHGMNPLERLQCLRKSEPSELARDAWNLCEHLLGPSPDATNLPQGRARILGYFYRFNYGNSLEDANRLADDFGFTGILTVEWWEDNTAQGISWVRHPEALLLPVNASFITALDSALSWACLQYFSGDKAKPSGYLRWRMDYDPDKTNIDLHLPCATGSSVGLATAVCLAQIWGDTEEDLSIAFSGTLLDKDKSSPFGLSDAEHWPGGLGEIKFDTQKREAAANAPMRVIRVIFPGTISSNTDADPYIVRRPHLNLSDPEKSVLPYLSEMNRPLRKWRACVRDACARIDLMRGQMGVGMDTEKGVYIDVPLLMAIDEPVIRSDMSHANSPGLPGEDCSEQSPAPDLLRDEALITSLLRFPLRWDRSNPCKIESCFPMREKRRIAVLGPPGSGKTTILRYLAWHATRPGDTFVRNTTGQRLIPTFVSLRRWLSRGASETSLSSYLAQLYRSLDGEPLPDEAQWARWLREGQVLLLIDAVDEIDTQEARRLRQELNPENCAGPVIFSCRTLQHEMLKEIGFTVGEREGSVFTPQPLTPELQRQYVARYAITTTEFSENEAETIAQNARHLDARLVSTPLLLDIVCYVREAFPEEPLPRTRTGLYDRAVQAQIRKLAKMSTYTGSGSEEGFRSSRASETMLRSYLEELAWGLTDAAGEPFPKSGGCSPRTIFPKFLVEDCLRTICKPDGVLSDDVLKDFTRHTRLLLGNLQEQVNETSFTFLHPNFQSFLVASYLAGRCDEKGLDASVSANDSSRRFVWEVIDGNSWLTAWEDTFVFLAGLLKRPKSDNTRVKMLDLLSDERRDDILRQRRQLTEKMRAEDLRS